MSNTLGPRDTADVEGVLNKNDCNAETVYDALTRTLTFESPDEAFWWRETAESLVHLLSSCNYSDQETLAHLRWYRRFIVPALGPHPVQGRKAQFTPCPVFDGSACEHSINWKELSAARIVRFTIEATGPHSGFAEDPFNQEEAKGLLDIMVKDVPGLDMKRFKLFTDHFFLPSDTGVSLMAKIPPGTPLSQVWVAFDLLRRKIMVKVYFMPILKWIHTGTPTRVLVSKAVRECGGIHGTYAAPMDLLNDYLRSFAPGAWPVVEMLAVDCIDSATSRIKIYLRTDVNTLAKAKEIYTLGGRISGQVVGAGLDALAELWPILFHLEGNEFEDVEVFPKGSYCGCAVEMKAGQAEPETKIHIPVRKIGCTDAQLCKSLSAWFMQRGHEDFAAKYEENLRATFPDHGLDTTNGTHTFVSFTYTRKYGVYMTMYYSTKILGVQTEKDLWEGYDNVWSVAASNGVPSS